MEIKIPSNVRVFNEEIKSLPTLHFQASSSHLHEENTVKREDLTKPLL
jgi:hypothetical protein